jgi:Protein of unknown function (DUF1549)/Protein of unknown function (DUF1553)
MDDAGGTNVKCAETFGDHPMKNWFAAAFLALPLLTTASVDCTYLDNPVGFFPVPEKRWHEISGWTEQVVATRKASMSRAMDSLDAPLPRKNLIDDYVFGRMERDGIRPAPLSTDEEFLRRLYLDLTGRIPSPEQVRSFLADTNPAKRDTAVDSLIGTEEFVDKWTMFLGDLFKNDGPSTNVNRYFQGRDTFYKYLREAVALNKPYYRIAQELIMATGDNLVNGAANWVVGGTVPMGPAQDTYDGQAVNLAQMFLGINVVDCLLCHDGARHLDNVNLWGRQQKRSDMWGLAAFFAQTVMKREVVSENPLYARFIVSDQPKGDYLLGTHNGNRTPRPLADESNSISPRYPFKAETLSLRLNRRFDLATAVTWDPQFARAAVNYVWEKIMVEALVSPSNSFDLARLDPNDPPPEGWALQPNNPELLEALSQWFRDMNLDMRQLIALIAKSNTYQLSSSYPGTWRPAYVPYYARKLARRMDAEEIHDAIVSATGVVPRYTMDYTGSLYPLPAASWAMQFPDTREPRTNGQVATFLNSFGRGDRDQTLRNTSGSLLQGLNMMNNNFVMTRIHADNDGSNVQRLIGMFSDSGRIVEELYLATLSRYPSPLESVAASEMMRQTGIRRGAELVQWSLLNKVEFLFSY